MEIADRNISLFEKATLRWLFEFAAQGYLVTDTELNIRSCNKWLEKQSGRAEYELVEQNLFDVFPELKTRGFDGYYRDALNGQSRILSHLLHKYLLPMPPSSPLTTLTQMQQSARIFPLFDENTVIGTITIIEDVTERVSRELELNAQIKERERLLASELAAREQAEQSSRLKEQFLATVSHEVRTPLNSISGWIQILLKGDLDETQRRHALDTIQKNVVSQTQIIEDLLDISRIITGQIRLDLRPLDLTESINAALDVISPAAKVKMIRIRKAIATRKLFVMGDTERLQQIFWNLLSNAIKFTPGGGQIEIALRESDHLAEFSIKDNGAGIEPDFLPFVFDRFRQADGTMRRNHGGLGLGLAIVKNLVEMHGGTISVESEGKNAGAIFRFTLPVLPSSPEISAQEIAGRGAMNRTSRDFAGLRILIVDDQPDSLEMLQYFLESHRALVIAASDAASALAQFRTFKPNILISDLGMPGMNGYDLIRKIRALPADNGGQTPAVALTGYAGIEEKLRVEASGFNAHLAKPVDLVELIAIINQLLGKTH